MKLYLLRHAEAENHAPTDEARQLTPRGFEQARAVGRYCARVGIAPELILFSPFVRTEQTARECVAGWPPNAHVLQSAPFVASGMNPEGAFGELRAYAGFASVMLIGHQPDLGSLAASLLGLRDAGVLPVGKATLIGLDIRWLTPHGASLECYLPVELMG